MKPATEWRGLLAEALCTALFVLVQCSAGPTSPAGSAAYAALCWTSGRGLLNPALELERVRLVAAQFVGALAGAAAARPLVGPRWGCLQSVSGDASKILVAEAVGTMLLGLVARRAPPQLTPLALGLALAALQGALCPTSEGAFNPALYVAAQAMGQCGPEPWARAGAYLGGQAMGASAAAALGWILSDRLD